MFPNWTAEQLFQPSTGERPLAFGAPAITVPASVVLPTGLRPYIEQAFTAEHVAIDFAGFSGETLHGVVQEPLDMIRTGQIKPASVPTRMLLPDTTRPMTVPCRVEDLANDLGYRARMHQITVRRAYAILETVQELARLGRIQEASTQIRAYQVPPLSKLYLLNGQKRSSTCTPLASTRSRSPTAATPCTTSWAKTPWSSATPHAAATPHAQFVEQVQGWFDAMWDHISYEFPA